MTFQLSAITYRSPRRVRLSFSEALGAGAFQVARYTVVSLEAAGTDRGVCAALLVPDAPHVVELAMDGDLFSRAKYQISCVEVPAAGAGVFSGSLEVATPAPAKAPSSAIEAPDVGALLYGIDLAWNGTDIAEGPGGDLATVSGLANVEAAVRRTLVADGLPWDKTYGPHLRGYVDAAPGVLPEMVGAIQRALRSDDRIQRVRVTTTPAREIGEVTVSVTGTLIGDNPLSVTQDVGR
jgi:hypothetical protein